MLTPSPSGEKNEQLIGRTHRKGQLDDEVGFDVFDTPTNDFQQALADAQYQTSMSGEPKKLLLADIVE